MLKAVLLAALLLAGCASPSEEAEQQYNIVAASTLATDAEKCRAARKVADAFLQAGNKERYEFWQLVAAGRCNS